MDKKTWKNHYRETRLYRKYGLPVDRGAEWLDEKEPGWAKKINIENLNIGNSHSCICGQLFVDRIHQFAAQNGYQYVIRKYFQPNIEEPGSGWRALEQMANLGFAMMDIHESTPEEMVWEDLAQYWVVQIEKRLAESGEML